MGTQDREQEPIDVAVDRGADEASGATWYETNDATMSDGEWVEVDLVADPTLIRSIRLRRSTIERLEARAGELGIAPAELLARWVEERLSDSTESPSADHSVNL